MRYYPVLDLEEARRVTDEAIIRAYAHASETLKQLLTDALCTVAQQQHLLTADDVWDYLGPSWERSLTHAQKSVLGHITRQAAQAEILQGTGTFERSARPRTHRKILPIWKSTVCDE